MPQKCRLKTFRRHFSYNPQYHSYCNPTLFRMPISFPIYGNKMPSETFVVSDGTFMSDAHRTGGKPGSVSDSHSSRHTVAGILKQPTRTLGGQRHCVLFGLAPNGVWPAAYCYQMRGAPLPHLFTLTCAAKAAIGGFAFCSTFRRVTVPGR